MGVIDRLRADDGEGQAPGAAEDLPQDFARDPDAAAWAASLLIHVVVLLALALSGVGEPPTSVRNPTVIEAPQVAEDEPEPLLEPREIVVAEDPAEIAGAASDQSDEVAQALAPDLGDLSVVPVEAEPEMLADIKVEPLDVLPTAQSLDMTVIVKGAVGVGATGAAGAVDQLTAEIAASLEQRPTVVCWVFDQSVSLSAQRRQIAERLDRVFEELGAHRGGGNRAGLTNMVVAFGQTVSMVTRKPTAEVDEVAKAIESIPVDDSGIEMTFHAIRKTAEAARIYRTSSPRKNVMIIVFSDEVGNDSEIADETAAYCRGLGIPVSVVGVPAPFGIREVRMKYVEFDPRYAQEEHWAVIEQGPETLYPESVRVRSGSLADEAIDSGFGPFSLSKLCAETGGIYFRVHANSAARGRVSSEQIAPMASQLRYFFDPEVMRAYQPEYLSAAKLDQQLVRNKAKRSLVEAAKISELRPMESPRTTFPRRDEGTLKNLLGEAQKDAAKLQPKIDALYETLKAGLPDRGEVREKRWQAGYDLALGRVLAVKVRTDAYNLMLAQASLGMNFKKPESDTWQLVSSDAVTVGSATEKLAKQARELLAGVVENHPGTPWAHLAAEELKLPLGYEWTEIRTGVNDVKPMAGNVNNNNNNPPRPRQDDKKKSLGPPKPRRDLKRL